MTDAELVEALMRMVERHAITHTLPDAAATAKTARDRMTNARAAVLQRFPELRAELADAKSDAEHYGRQL